MGLSKLIHESQFSYFLFFINEITNPPLATSIRMHARKNIVIGWLSVWHAAAIPKNTAATKKRIPGMSFVTSVIKKVCGVYGLTLCLSRGKRTPSLIFWRPSMVMMRRSVPRPQPACGGIPYLNGFK